jgi:sulfofructose kinase
MARESETLHPEAKRRVVCLGAAAIDHVFTVAAIPPRPTKVQATSHRERQGGDAATAALTIAALGHAAAYWGRVGCDANGARVLARLTDAGVDCATVRRVADAKTATAVAVRDDGGRQLVASFAGAGLGDDPDWLPLDALAGVDAVLADTSWPAGARSLLRAARASGVPSVVIARADVDDPTCVAELAALADHAPVAATGCGEGFHGAYALAVARGLGALEAMRFAVGVATVPARGTR